MLFLDELDAILPNRENGLHNYASKSTSSSPR